MSPSGSGKASTCPFQNSISTAPAAPARAQARISGGHVHSDYPPPRADRDAMSESRPAPQPASTTVSPGLMGPRANGLPVPANEAITSSGRPAYKLSG